MQFYIFFSRDKRPGPYLTPTYWQASFSPSVCFPALVGSLKLLVFDKWKKKSLDKITWERFKVLGYSSINMEYWHTFSWLCFSGICFRKTFWFLVKLWTLTKGIINIKIEIENKRLDTYFYVVETPLKFTLLGRDLNDLNGKNSFKQQIWMWWV